MHDAIVGLIYGVVSSRKADRGAVSRSYRSSTLDAHVARIGNEDRRAFHLIAHRYRPTAVRRYVNRLRST